MTRAKRTQAGASETLSPGKVEKVDDIVKTGSEDGFDDSEWGKGEYISQEKKRSMEFVTLFRNLHGDIPEVHPDYTEYKHKTIRINPTSMAYFELLNRMRKIGMFSDMPREVVAQMERKSRACESTTTRVVTT